MTSIHYVMIYRSGPTEKYCAEPALKNEFLRDLEREENVSRINLKIAQHPIGMHSFVKDNIL